MPTYEYICNRMLSLKMNESQIPIKEQNILCLYIQNLPAYEVINRDE